MTQLPTQSEVLAHYKATIAEMVSWVDGEFGTNFKTTLRPIVGFKVAKRWGSAGDEGPGHTPYMKLNFGMATTYPLIAVTEYRSYAHSPVIGSIPTSDWRIWIDMLVAHEFSHVIQMHFIHHVKAEGTFMKGHRIDGTWVPSESSHGALFRTIYAKLRVKFINHRATNIGRVYGTKSFDIPNEVMAAKRPKLTNHPLVGRAFRMNGCTWTVESHMPTMKKYDMLCDNGVKKMRFSSQNVVKLLASDEVKKAA